jgi:alpha-L-rhamnosidase
LGVKPTAPGYQTYTVQPVLGGLKWMNGHVPTPDGAIMVKCSTKEISISTAAGIGTLRFQSKVKPACKGETIERKNNWYELTLQPHKSYTVTYAAQ